MMLTRYDELEIYCRMLGHPLKFSYCRSTGNNVPCPRIEECWQGRIPIREFLEYHFDEELIRRLSDPPKPKITTIIEMIEQAEKSRESKE